MLKKFTFPEIPFRWSMPLFYAALFASFSIYLPFIPVWLATKGLAAWQISLCLSLPMLSRLASPLSGFLADRAQSRRHVIMGLLAVGIGLGIGLNEATGFAAILLLFICFNFAWNPVLPITEAFAVYEAERRGVDYGRLRVWGSASFVVFNVIGGLVLTGQSAELILPFMLFLMALALLAARFLPAEGGSGVGKVRFQDVRQLLRQKNLIIFMLGAGLIQASHGFYYSFASVDWVSKAYAGWLIGLLWATGVFAETILFLVAGRMIGSVSATKLALIGGFLASFRWFLMGFEPPLALLFVLQGLHAASFALTHLATMKFIHQHVPPDLAATGQGLFTAISAGALTGLVMFASGTLYESFGAFGFLGMAVVSLSGVALLFSPKVWRALAA